MCEIKTKKFGIYSSKFIQKILISKFKFIPHKKFSQLPKYV